MRTTHYINVVFHCLYKGKFWVQVNIGSAESASLRYLLNPWPGWLAHLKLILNFTQLLGLIIEHRCIYVIIMESKTFGSVIVNTSSNQFLKNFYVVYAFQINLEYGKSKNCFGICIKTARMIKSRTSNHWNRKSTC